MQCLYDELGMDIIKNTKDTRINRTILYNMYKEWCGKHNYRYCRADVFYTDAVKNDKLVALKSHGNRLLIITASVKATLLELNIVEDSVWV